MTAEDFVTWLQGFAELTESPPTAEQWRIIRQRAANVGQEPYVPCNIAVTDPITEQMRRDIDRIKREMDRRKIEQGEIAEEARITRQKEIKGFLSGTFTGSIKC